MSSIGDTIIENDKPEDENITVVRLSTECYMSGTKIVQKKCISMLKRKSRGYSVLECMAEGGIGDEVHKIVNLDTCQDGIYLLDYTNISTDWETGRLDDWDYILRPYEG